jgi:16S rRNA (uracil1498-N3)-methyltransferase
VAHLYIADGMTEVPVGASILLTGQEARHAATVSRLRVGERVLLTNGTGLLVEAETVSIAKVGVGFNVISSKQLPAPQPRVILVQALAKGDRDERAIEMATELGVSTVIPWQAARSVSRWEGEKAEKGQQRWQTIVREASKQAVRAWIPNVTRVHSTADVLSASFSGLTLVLDPSGSLSVSAALTSFGAEQPTEVRVIVGPEGGLTADEVDQYASAGAVIVGLGSNILRTSTAGPAVIAVLNEMLGRW